MIRVDVHLDIIRPLPCALIIENIETMKMSYFLHNADHQYLIFKIYDKNSQVIFSKIFYS